jgi:hypothetical protein
MGPCAEELFTTIGFIIIAAILLCVSLLLLSARLLFGSVIVIRLAGCTFGLTGVFLIATQFAAMLSCTTIV